MLSILIPIYNFRCKALVESLHSQAEQLGIEYEIILADDASTQYIDEIAELASSQYVRFFSFTENQGRSRIRNFLASKALYRYLLFLDCDAEVCSDDFLKKYVEVIRPDVCVYGGRALYPYRVTSEYALESEYNRKREVNYVKDGIFTTFNFLIDRKIFEKIGFDESITTYGHEDTIFALKCREQTDILFIENPLVHLGISTNRSYLHKVELSCRNVAEMSQTYSDDVMRRMFKVWRAYSKLRALHLAPMLQILYNRYGDAILKNLLSDRPSLIYLALYKLLYLSFCMQTIK